MMDRSKTRPAILIGVTGSVDAMQLPQYIRAFRAGMECTITLILTPDALKFVNPDSLGLIVERVICGENPADWSADRPGKIAGAHDIMIVLPSTANTLAAAAHGTCQNRMTMMFLVGTFPILFFPVMGPTMWDKPVVQGNVNLVRKYGHKVFEPAWKEQYEPDFGRMYGHYTLPEPDVVLGHIKAALDEQDRAAATARKAG